MPDVQTAVQVQPDETAQAMVVQSDAAKICQVYANAKTAQKTIYDQHLATTDKLSDLIQGREATIQMMMADIGSIYSDLTGKSVSSISALVQQLSDNHPLKQIYDHYDQTISQYDQKIDQVSDQRAALQDAHADATATVNNVKCVYKKYARDSGLNDDIDQVASLVPPSDPTSLAVNAYNMNLITDDSGVALSDDQKATVSASQPVPATNGKNILLVAVGLLYVLLG